ncbi:MAG: SufS family cysteine desulfurase [Planctomycetales bacterium]|nr:SufS family cysteine desulfurase [Planctomycetales bacterium]
MQALTPELLSEATAKLFAQLPGQAALTNFAPTPEAVPVTPASGFSPMNAGTPFASSFPSQPSAPTMATPPAFQGTPTRPAGFPAVPRVGFPNAELPAAFVPLFEPQVPVKSITAEPFATAVPGVSGFSFSEFPIHPGHTSSIAHPGDLNTFRSSEASPAVDSHDGLKAFVQRIQSGEASGEKSLCESNQDLERIRQSFKSSNTRNSRPVIFDVHQIRKDFPILHQKVNNHDLVWFDNAATTQKPIQVMETLSHFYSNDNSNIHRAAHTLAARATDAYEGARKKIQNQVGASSPDEIIFVRGTTEGMNLVANTLGKALLQPGDEIVLSELEHHANIVPWQLIAKDRGAVLKVIPVNDHGEVLLDQYQRLLGPKTRIVSLTHASNSLGTILPVAEMTHMARRVGARVVIDGAQSISHMPINVNEIGCDFFVFSGHKIFGPTGIGAVYARREVQEILPPWQGGGNMIRNVTFEETTYSDTPAKFEAGTPNIADAVGLGAALDYVNQVGIHNIGQYEHSLLQYGTERLSMINGLRIIGTAREKVSVISFVLGDMPPEKVGQLLDKHGIAVRSGHHCAQPSLRRFGVEATVRPSFAFYNTVDEIDHLVEVVRRIHKRS